MEIYIHGYVVYICCNKKKSNVTKSMRRIYIKLATIRKKKVG